MDESTIRSALADIEQRHGKWTAHNIRLSDNVYTMGPHEVGSAGGVRRFLQAIGDNVQKPWNQIRMLDLGCLEGLYALEAARSGAEAVGIDARETHIAKAECAKKILALQRATFLVGDVRDIALSTHGTFDAILCAGLLYHLDAPDVFRLLRSMFALCTRCVVIETRTSIDGKDHVIDGNKTYRGTRVREHPAESTLQERKNNLWASIDNPESFWLTKISLLNALSHCGFTSVYECENPPLVREPDRCTLVALKGSPYRMQLPSPDFTHWPSGDTEEPLPPPTEKSGGQE